MAVGLLNCGNAFAAIKDQSSPVIYWENVEGEPRWVGGVKPVYSTKNGLHGIGLMPGADSIIHLNRNEWLRIRTEKGKLKKKDLLYFSSNGTALFRQISSIAGYNSNERLLSADAYENRWIRVYRPVGGKKEKRIVLFISRKESFPITNPIRDIINLQGSAIRIRGNGRYRGDKFWMLDSGESITINEPDQRKLYLKSRYIFGTDEKLRRKNYRIYADINNKGWRVLESIGIVDNESYAKVNNSNRLIGKQDIWRLDLPSGVRTLRLKASSDILLQLRVNQPKPWLAESINSSLPLYSKDRDSMLNAGHRQSSWSLSDRRVRQTKGKKNKDNLWPLAVRLARDNRFRNGRITATTLLENYRQQHKITQDQSARFKALSGSSMMYRSLLPGEKAGKEDYSTAWFRSRRLIRSGHTSIPLLGSQHLSSSLGAMGRTRFVTLGNKNHKLTYDLPARGGPGRIRLVIKQQISSEPATLWLKFDRDRPQQINYLPKYRAKNSLKQIGLADVGMTALSNQFSTGLQGTQGAAFGTHRPTGSLTEVDTVELELPTNSKKVTLWINRRGITLPISVQVLQARAKGLDMHVYNKALSQAGTKRKMQALFIHRLDKLLDNGKRAEWPRHSGRPDLQADALFEVVNHWHGLMQLLYERSSGYRKSLSLSKGVAKKRSINKALARRLRAQGLREMKKKQWLNALETWSRIAQQGNTNQRREAWQHQIDALIKLNEYRLAERMLNITAITDTDPKLRKISRDRLIRYYKKRERNVSTIGLAAIMLQQKKDVEGFRMLINALADTGRYNEALTIALLIPEDDWPAESVALSGLMTDNKRIYQESIKYIKNSEQQHLWKGYDALLKGNFSSARYHWRRSGADGMALVASLDQGQKIRQRLIGSTNKQRQKILEEWSNWQTTHPGQRLWRSENEWIRSFDRGGMYRPISHNRWRSLYRAAKDNPVIMELSGPVTLRINMRPEHRAGTNRPISGWVNINRGKTTDTIPVNANRKRTGTDFIGGNGREIGSVIRHKIVLGPGLHRLAVSSKQFPIWLSVEVKRPEIPLPVLPRITIESVAALMSNKKIRYRGRCRVFGHCAEIVYSNRIKKLHLQTQRTVENEIVQRARKQLLKLANIPGKSVEYIGRVSGQTCHLNRWLQEQTGLPPIPHPAEISRVIANQVKKLEGGSNKQKRRSLVIVETLAKQCPETVRIDPGYMRVRRAGHWQRLTSISASAGIRQHVVEGWAPESVTARVRRALMGPMSPDEWILLGSRQLVFSLRSKLPRKFQINLSVATVSHGQLEPMTLVYSIDKRKRRSVSVSGDRRNRQISISIPAGVHVLRLRLAHPVRDHYLRIRVKELGRGKAREFRQRKRRNYQVATHQEPLIIQINGPAWLRIDKRVSGKTQSNYRLIAKQNSVLTLRPDKNESEAEYRIFSREPQKRPGILSSRVLPQTKRLAQMDVTPARRSRVWKVIRPHDTLLGRSHEDGTWRYGVRGVSRRNLDEDQAGADQEVFLGFQAGHEYYNSNSRTYRTNSLELRSRQTGGAVLGFQHDRRYQLDKQGREWSIKGILYAQAPGGASLIPAEQVGTEWAATIQTGIKQRNILSPKLTNSIYGDFLLRSLSLDSSARYQAGRLDQDVYTDYKRDHPAAIQIGDRLSYRPWLDTRIQLAASLVSNADLSASLIDHASLRLAWAQYLKGWQVEAKYKHKQYLTDTNRASDITRRILQFNILQEKWPNAENRWIWQMRWAHDLDTRNNSIWLGVTLYRSHGRLYRDSGRHRTMFHNLRQDEMQMVSGSRRYDQ